MTQSVSFNHKTRKLDLTKLQKQNVFDVVIVGAGITGAAVFRDATLRGLRCLLLEKDDFGSGTSSRSSKLVHGGVRYLEQFEFGLVHESTLERERLLQNAPSYVQALRFIFPAWTYSRVPLWKLNLGLWLYELLARFSSPGLHKMWNTKQTLELSPSLESKNLSGSITYFDAATDDAMLTLGNVVDGVKHGGVAISRAKVTGLHSENPDQHKVIFQDVLTGSNHTVLSRVVVLATGPWLNGQNQWLGRSSALMAPTRGSHIVVPATRLGVKDAHVLFHPKDGRVLFVIPWGEATVVGTTDIFDDASPDGVCIRAEEVSYLLDAANSFFPSTKPLHKGDVLSTWSGLRPLLAPQKNASASEVSRDHHLNWSNEGIVTITGGKLTTNRSMAEATVDLILERTRSWPKPLAAKLSCPTRHRSLPQMDFPRVALPGNLYPGTGSPKNLPPRLGSSEASHFTPEDVEGILQTQMVLSLEDFAVRRTQLFYKELDHGLGVLKLFKPLFLQLLEWSETQWDKSMDDYMAYLERHIEKPLGRKIQNN